MNNKVIIPENYNYIGVFLTLSCNLTCSYCINHLSGEAVKKRFLKGQEWVKQLNRLELSNDVPLSIQGGEPTIHPHFYEIINQIDSRFPIDLLTNIQFDPNEFMKNISPDRIKRSAKYSSIRVTFHPETMDWKTTLNKVKILHDNEYSIGIFGIAHPKDINVLAIAQKEAQDLGIDFRMKEFLGIYENKVYGDYKYPNAVFSTQTKNCLCKTSELLIAPDGQIYRCHHDLYNKVNGIGDLADSNFKISDSYSACDKFGNCNPCDVKIKNNRFQEWGHTSVDIKL
jgi:sulfatase maturation enzyme AslB (radical SAM superfamily)